MKTMLLLIAVVLLGAGCAGSDEIASIEPALLPTSGTVTVAQSDLTYSSDSAISPTGAARVSPADGQWCLEDASGVRCVDAAAEGSASHGILWRPDEQAIAVTWGAQDPISVIDFEAGTAVETDLDRHRLLAWSPSGDELLGLQIDRPGELLRLDPTSLEPSGFAELPLGGVPQVLWTLDDVVWGSTPRVAEVFTVAPGDDPVRIAGGLGEQLLLSASADGRLALALDDEVLRGAPGPDDTVLTLFDRAEGRSAGVDLPADIDQRAPRYAQLSPDGRVMLVLHQTDAGGLGLSSAAVEPETLATSSWTTVVTWDADDGLRPIAYASNGMLRWDGGDTAWVIGDAGDLIEVALT